MYPHWSHIYLVGGDWNMTFLCPYIGNNHPNWLIFFRGIETTNQLWPRFVDEYSSRELFLANGYSHPLPPDILQTRGITSNCLIQTKLNHFSSPKRAQNLRTASLLVDEIEVKEREMMEYPWKSMVNSAIPSVPLILAAYQTLYRYMNSKVSYVYNTL